MFRLNVLICPGWAVVLTSVVYQAHAVLFGSMPVAPPGTNLYSHSLCRVSTSSSQFQTHAAQGEPRYHTGLAGFSHISIFQILLAFPGPLAEKVQVPPPCGAAHYD